MLIFETYQPKILPEYVARFDYYRMNRGSEKKSCYSFLPLGAIQLLFQLDTPIEHKTAFSNGWQQRPNAFIAGPFDKTYELKIPVSSMILAVTFKATKFRNFSNLPMNELKNKLLHPAEIWGNVANELIEQVVSTDSNRGRIYLIETFLVKQLRTNLYSPLETSIASILKNNGTGEVRKYAQLSHLSISHYRKRFADEVGLSPKVFQKLVRVRAMAKYYREQPSVSLTSLAYEFAYFDQSHFIKEFRSVADSPPRAFLQNRRFLQF